MYRYVSHASSSPHIKIHLTCPFFINVQSVLYEPNPLLPSLLLCYLLNQCVEQEAALVFNDTNSNIDNTSAASSDISNTMATNSGVDGVFVDYLARTVDAAAAASSQLLHNRHNHVDRNSSINKDNHNYQDDGIEEDAPSPELSRKVGSNLFLFSSQHR